MDNDISLIRNFCIIAHIDHGKSTLADRMLELTNTISVRERREQVLDSMDLERERGITIKASPVRLLYTAHNQKTYIFNLIDTPGHVDFNYEVSRSIAACEGAVLVVDAAQGVEAQTVANVHLAVEQNLTIIPVLNKIDLPNAEPEKVKKQIEHVLGIDINDIVLISAKEGLGVPELMEKVVQVIPPPPRAAEERLKALVIDSVYNNYRGVILYVRIYTGSVKARDMIQMMHNGLSYEVQEVGIFHPKMRAVDSLSTGIVGYIIANIKTASEVKIGDTITLRDMPASEPLAGFRDVHPMVFCGIYPVNSGDFDMLKEALEKLKLNDYSLMFTKESSVALGFGYRCGFLGLLHMEIIQERLEREFQLNIITTSPSVLYRILNNKGDILEIDNPVHFPQPHEIEAVEEPVIKASIITPIEYIGSILQIVQDRRGINLGTETLSKDRVILVFELPLNEILTDFYDKLKSITRGYASLDYDLAGYRLSDVVKLDILLNGEPVDAFSCIVHKSKAHYKGKQLVKKLHEVIPRHLFEIAIQATVGSKILARETIRALKKNVTAKCYGGDITRKRKLWEKQKEGKKRMKQVGRVTVPQEAFLAVLRTDE